MNEGAKTGIYWAAALVMLAVAVFVSWPPQTDSDTQSLIGQPLFPAFSDPLSASSLRIVTFDDSLGEVRRFEVAKDEATGVWSLPSRNNYPADASEQMQRAANALVGVKILDIQTENAEDHASLGVVEPNPESLEVGDEGVGRLVSIKGEKNVTLANIIIGNPVGDAGDRRFVRIPQQDPVYVVNLQDTVFSTKFEDWIEKDLLQLSSIDIRTIAIESYDAALEGGNSLSLNRSYDARLAVDSSNAWELISLSRYDDQQQPREVSLAEGEKLAVSKLNEIKNALDDLKIVDVAAKPKGMSESLKADKDLVSDNEAVRSLAVRGFFPVSSGDILSANGEMKVTLDDGVQYILRFGNVQGLSAEGDTEDDETAVSGGANRYLLVTAQVDESKFPPPELKPIPKSIQELDAMSEPEAQADAQAEEQTDAATPAATTPEDVQRNDVQIEEVPRENSDDPTAADPAPAEPPAPESSDDQPEPQNSADPAVSGDEITTGEGTAGGAGQGQDQQAPQPVSDQPASDQPVAEEPADETRRGDAAADESAASGAQQPEPVGEVAAPASDPTEAPEGQTPAAEPSEEPTPADETDEEKQERLEAEQEKITKENQRKLDERKDRVEAARRRVRELNARFADWYYVIPESTYRKLRITLDDLIEKPTAAEDPAAPAAEDDSSQAPSFDFLPAVP